MDRESGSLTYPSLRDLIRSTRISKVYVVTDFALSVRITKKEALALIDRINSEGPWRVNFLRVWDALTLSSEMI